MNNENKIIKRRNRKIKKITISVSLDIELMEDLKKQSKEDNRGISNLVNYILDLYMSEKRLKNVDVNV